VALVVGFTLLAVDDSTPGSSEDDSASSDDDSGSKRRSKRSKRSSATTFGCPSGMASIPGGSFMMGSNDRQTAPESNRCHLSHKLALG